MKRTGALVCCIIFGLQCEPSYLRSHAIWHQRILDAISCHDCDDMPKVDRAGKYFFENGTIYQLMHNGIKAACDNPNRGWLGCIVEKLRGHYRPREERLFYEIIKTAPANSVMVELGSYWAYYSAWFKRDVPGSANYVIEASPDILEIAQKNFRLNGLTGKFRLAFIADEAELKCTSNNPLTALGFSPQTPIIGIDQLVAEECIPFVWLLRCDVGGFEYQMLATAKKTMAQGKIDNLFISTHSIQLHDKCCQFLRESNFTITANYAPKNAACNGLIVAQLNHTKGSSNKEI